MQLISVMNCKLLISQTHSRDTHSYTHTHTHNVHHTHTHTHTHTHAHTHTDTQCVCVCMFVHVQQVSTKALETHCAHTQHVFTDALETHNGETDTQQAGGYQPYHRHMKELSSHVLCVPMSIRERRQFVPVHHVHQCRRR